MLIASPRALIGLSRVPKYGEARHQVVRPSQASCDIRLLMMGTNLPVFRIFYNQADDASLKVIKKENRTSGSHRCSVGGQA